MNQEKSGASTSAGTWDLRHPGLVMKDGEREVHEFTGMWPLKPDADLVKFTNTLAFREFWNPPELSFSEATTLLGLVRAARWFVGTSTEFGPTLYFVSQFDSSLEKYFDDFVLNGKGAYFIQPDFQYIVRPGGTGRLPNAPVLGTQLGINF